MSQDPQKTAVAPQKTAVAPPRTAPQKTAVAPPRLSVSKPKAVVPPPAATGKAISGGAEADVETVERGGKKYALKTYHKGFHPNVAVTGALSHLGGKGYVVDIYETGTASDGREYELMEYLPSGSLAQYDLKGDASAITAIVLRVAMALDACHRSGVVHRDVKPANILVRDTNIWDCVLCDFGIAAVLSSGRAVVRQSRTPVYAAPEIYDPSRAKARIDGEDLFEIGPEADFYSLGMTALCLWSGEDAFLAAEDRMAVDKLGRGISAPREMPERLRHIVDGLLRKDPSARWGLADIEKSLGGHWAVMHTLNPLSDVRLGADLSSPDYAMTGEKIGEFLNKVYMWQFADAKAPASHKLCQAVVDSFSKFEGSYMQIFFESKGDRFADQQEWMQYCCDWESDDNASKAGPQDEDTRLEISMMKTIKGFGFSPYYEFDSGVASSLEDLDGIDPYDRKYALSHGLKGWLAVQYHEDPYADLSEEYAYEDLLEDYVLKLGEIDEDNDECGYYFHARHKAEDLHKEISSTVHWMRFRTVVQKIAGALLVILPLAGVAIWAFVSLHHKQTLWTVVILLASLFFLVRFLVKVWFVRASGVRQVPDLGFEELTLEPLYYTFSDESDFDSSLNEVVLSRDYTDWKPSVKAAGRKTVLYILISLAILTAASSVLPRTPSAGEQNIQTNEQVQ